VRIYKNGWFGKFAARERIDDATLCAAIRQIEQGLIDADLGSGVLKQRIARARAGKSGGYRTVIFFRRGERAIFVFAFAKNDRANLDAEEIATFKRAAKILLALPQARMDIEVEAGRLTEVSCDGKNL
jgi:hypothetical protein